MPVAYEYLHMQIEQSWLPCWFTKQTSWCNIPFCNRYRAHFLPKCPLTTVRSRLRGEAEGTFAVRPH